VTREQLEHIIGAAASIAEDDDIVVIGSQAILGQFPDAPAELLISMEADVYPRNHPDRADLIDGSIGELSLFHDTFGYYAQGVGEETATLPRGYAERLIPVRSKRTRGATGWCLEAHDLVIAKAFAGREKDERFILAALRRGLVKAETLYARLAETERDPELHDTVRRRLEVWIGASAQSSP
jgi:hypothetical protein